MYWSWAVLRELVMQAMYYQYLNQWTSLWWPPALRCWFTDVEATKASYVWPLRRDMFMTLWATEISCHSTRSILWQRYIVQGEPQIIFFFFFPPTHLATVYPQVSVAAFLVTILFKWQHWSSGWDIKWDFPLFKLMFSLISTESITCKRTLWKGMHK